MFVTIINFQSLETLLLCYIISSNIKTEFEADPNVNGCVVSYFKFIISIEIDHHLLSFKKTELLCYYSLWRYYHSW